MEQNGTNLFSKINDHLDGCLTDNTGLIYFGRCMGIPPVTASLFQHGAILIQTDGSTGANTTWVNIGSTAVPSWSVSTGGGGGGGGASITTPNTWTALQTFANGLVSSSTTTSALFANLEGTLYADQFPGADIGAQINAAYAALPSRGGTIVIANGSYSFSTPIVCNTLNKPVLLKGDPAGAATLTYTGGTTTVACTINVTKAVTPGYGIQGLKFVGPGSGGSTVGIQLGGMGADDNKGFAGGTLRDVHVRGFGCNILIGNNAFIVTLDNVISNFGGKLLFAKGGAGLGATTWLINGANTINSGERMIAMNCTFADANNQLFSESTARYAVHLQESGLVDWKFIATTFDDAELYIDTSGGTSNQVQLEACHFENPAADSIAVYTFITTLSASTSLALDLTDCTFVQDASASAAAQFINAGCQVTAKGCSIGRNTGAGAATLGAFVNFQNADATNNLRYLGVTSFSNAATNIATSSAGSLSMTGGIGVVNGLMSFSKISGAGDLFAKSFNTIYDASQFPGADIGAKINNAYAAGVAAGFKGMIITVPAGAQSFSTPIVFGTDTARASLRGAPGGGTELDFTGAGGTIACTINTGNQGSGSSAEHSSYEAIKDITFKGNRTSSTTPTIGVYMGGTFGAAGACLVDVNIEGFGQGLFMGQNTYHTGWYNGVIRNCAQLIFINTPNNSGEGIHFYNGFFVDAFDAAAVTANGIQIADSGVASLLFSGCSFDDTQIRIGQANNVSFHACHFENPGSATWGAYTYISIDNNVATNVNFTGNTFFSTGTVLPTNYISNGGTVTMTGDIIRKFNATGVTTMCVITGSGVLQWSGLHNVSGLGITNIVSGIPAIPSGWTNSTGLYSTVTATGVHKVSVPYTTTATTYAILSTDEIVATTTGPITVTLPTAVGLTGKRYTIKNTGGTTNTIATTSSQTIDGTATTTSVAANAKVTIFSDNANWQTI